MNKIMEFSENISNLKGVGPKSALVFENIGITTVKDLFDHIPYKYEDRSNYKKITELIPNEKFSLICIVDKINNIYTKGGYRLTTAKVTDETGSIDVIWFNQQYITKSVHNGSRVILYGKLDPKNKKPQINSPEWEIFDETNESQPILPVYPATEGINSKFIAKLIKQNIDSINFIDPLDDKTLKSNNLISLREAYYFVHQPENYTQIHEGRKRLSFDELFYLHIKGMKIRQDWLDKQHGYNIEVNKKDLDEFTSNLPFKLTKAQSRSINEVIDDINSDKPMNRLLQGDVGSGKTVVAASSTLMSYYSDFSSIIIAPTQILAEQHYETLKKFIPKNIQLELITGNTKRKSITKGIIIGTHAILHRLEDINNVGLIVIDEQHRFGVTQRSKLVDFYTEVQKQDLFTEHKLVPNLLTMTATPIPRSLALTFYGDLDLSVIDEMPKGRKIVNTWVVKENKRKSVYEWINREIEENKTQVFVVCPFIEESDHDNFQNVKAAEVEFEKIKDQFTNRKVALLHGKMSNDEKSAIISDFSDHKYDILVTTPVIEVGVDFPNANIIIIETPERFGLASLHQLRGRVGRGSEQGSCVLITDSNSENSYKRLKYLEKTHNGTILAEIDMKIRGPGNIYGSEQHGFMNLKIADITDIDMIKLTKSVALDVFTDRKKYPSIDKYISDLDYIGDD